MKIRLPEFSAFLIPSLFWEYTERSKAALDTAGIQIPYPHLQLLVEQSEAMRQLARRAPLG